MKNQLLAIDAINQNYNSYSGKIDEKNIVLNFDNVDSLIGFKIDRLKIKSILNLLDFKINNVTELIKSNTFFGTIFSRKTIIFHVLVGTTTFLLSNMPLTPSLAILEAEFIWQKDWNFQLYML